MKFSTVAVLALAQVALGALVEKRNCPKNNCQRALLQSTRAAQVSSDCSSFQSITVTYAATTSTEVTTTTSTNTNFETSYVTYYTVAAGASKIKRHAMAAPAPTAKAIYQRRSAADPMTVSPTALPTYASKCTTEGAFANACSCFGVTQVTTTISDMLATETSITVESTSITATVGLETTLAAEPTAFAGQCYDDNAERALPALSYFDMVDMTIEKCAAFCVDYAFYGVEAGFACFCDNTFELISNSASGACDVACSGDPNEICGGSFAINVFLSAPAVTPK